MLGLAALEAMLSINFERVLSIFNDIAIVQSQTGHVGGLVGLSDTLPGPPDYKQLSLEVSRISQLISWRHVTWKSCLHLCEFMAQSATRLEVLEDGNTPRYPESSAASAKHSKALSELLGADKSRIIHCLDLLVYYKELCVIQNQNVCLDASPDA